MAKLFWELGFKVGAEIGVADGQNSLTLCKSIPDLALLCVDPWEMYKGNPRAHDNQDEMFRIAQERLAPYDVSFMKAMSMDAVREIADESLDFVYIDGNHCFDYVMQDLIEWAKKVRPGGIVSGHDYYRFRWAGVVDAVDAYVKAHQIIEWFVTDEKETTFFWAK
jgi:predicted O-methyltransferase YrrM